MVNTDLDALKESGGPRDAIRDTTLLATLTHLPLLTVTDRRAAASLIRGPIVAYVCYG